MTTATLNRELSHQCWEYERPMPGGIVAGVDGSRASIAALNTAATIARRLKFPLHVVSVIDPSPSYELKPGIDVRRESLERLRMQMRKMELGALMKSIEPSSDWTHEVVVGSAPRSLVSIAESRDAHLIVLGRHHHGVVDRFLGNETTLHVMRVSPIPVLGVQVDLATPKTIVLATDFSVSSVIVGRAALEMIGVGGRFYLVHVEQNLEQLPSAFSIWDPRSSRDIAAAFERFVTEFHVPAGVSVEKIVLSGQPGSAVAAFAEQVGADMIAAGSHGGGRFERFLIGSVSTWLIRHAGCAVMVAPPRG